MTSIQRPLETSTMIRPVQLLAMGDLSQVPAPLIRVRTCGLLTLELVQEIVSTDPPQARSTVLTPDVLRGRGVSPALSLLKLLVSRPQRFAPADWLLEQFSRGEGEAFSTKRLDTLAWKLRDLLCPPAYESLRRQVVAHTRAMGGTGYQLAGYPLIWVDHEALSWQVEQAVRMERFGDDPLPFWQRAYELARRGDYLPDEIYSEWADAKREEIAGLRRQSVLAVTRLLAEREGRAGEEQALVLLRSYWLEHPREEDILRPLMELLGKRECYQEALEYYAKLCRVLEEDGQQPTRQTRDVAEYIQRLELRRPARISTSSISSPIPTRPSIDLSSSNRRGDIMNIVRELEETTSLEWSDMLQRRALIAHLLGLSSVLLGIDQQALKNLTELLPSLEEDPFTFYEDFLILGRGCLNNGGPLVTQRIYERSNTLLTYTQHIPSIERGRWLALLCQFYQLSSSFAHRDLDRIHALRAATSAIEVALEIEHVELLTSSFFRRGRIYLDCSHSVTQPIQQQRYITLARADIDAALDYAEQVRNPLRGNIYLIAAELYGKLSERDSSLTKRCDQWHDVVAQFLAQGAIEDDGSFLHLSASALHHERAKVLLHRGCLQEARQELTMTWKTLQPNPLTWYGNTHMTEAYLYKVEHDLEGCIQSGIAAYKIAQALPSQKLQRQVWHLFKELQQIDQWHPSVRQFGEILRYSGEHAENPSN